MKSALMNSKILRPVTAVMFDRSRIAYTAPEGSARTVKYLRIHSLDSTPNYLYAVLYPPALIFDIVTFPFQFVYLYALGSSLPPR